MSFSQVRITGNKSNPDFVYYNATVINNEVTTTAQTDDPSVTFQDTRQTPLVVDTSQYTVSVENFSMNGVTKTLPLFIPQIQTGGGVNNTIYSVTFSAYVSGTYYSQEEFIQWEPENKTLFTVVPTTFNPQSESDYYYCYTYTHWVRLVNKALLDAWTVVSSASSLGTQCPFFEFDETTGLFSLNQDAKTSIIPIGGVLPYPYNFSYSPTGSYTNDEYSFVGCNANLEGLLSNFDSDYYAQGVQWSGSNITLPESVFNFGLTNLNNPSGVFSEPVGVSLKTKPTFSNVTLRNPFTNAEISDAVFVRMTQDYISTGSLWSPISSFVIATNQIPVRSEFVAAPVRLGSDNLGGGGVNASFQKVLLEVPINAITADLWRGWVVYEPLTPTKSSLDAVHDGLTQLDFSLYWRNRLTNSLVPCRIYNSGTFSLRLLFERRGL